MSCATSKTNFINYTGLVVIGSTVYQCLHLYTYTVFVMVVNSVNNLRYVFKTISNKVLTYQMAHQLTNIKLNCNIYNTYTLILEMQRETRPLSLSI